MDLSIQTQQLPERHDGVEIAVGFDDGCQVAFVDKGRFDGTTASVRKSTDFLLSPNLKNTI